MMNTALNSTLNVQHVGSGKTILKAKNAYSGKQRSITVHWAAGGTNVSSALIPLWWSIIQRDETWKIIIKP